VVREHSDYSSYGDGSTTVGGTTVGHQPPF
jgi:hypothetical protein